MRQVGVVCVICVKLLSPRNGLGGRPTTYYRLAARRCVFPPPTRKCEFAKLGVLAALIVLTGLALLWMTEAVPRSDIREFAPKALGAVVIVVVASVLWSVLRGRTAGADSTDKPVP